MSKQSEPIADPVLTELLRYELLAVSEEMLATMRRTTRSVLAREGADYGTAVLDSEGQIVAQAVPYGYMYFHIAGPYVAQKFAGRLHPGDVVITNDPYGGVSHLPDIVFIKPIFHEGQLACFAAVAQHHTDIGGRFPGGNGAASESIFEEGLRLPAIKLYHQGNIVEPVKEIIEANVRAPEDVLGDLDAAMAACRRGEIGIQRLFDKYGREEITAYWQDSIANSEHLMRDLISSFPDGKYRAVTHFNDADLSVDVVATMSVNNDELVIDLSDSSPQVRFALNVPYGMTTTMPIHLLIGFLGGLEGVGLNSGLLRPISVIAPEGTVANPRFPAAVGSRSQIFNRILQASRDCLVQIAPNVVPAAGEGFNGAIYASPGANARERFRMVTEFIASGWGAGRSRDGIDGVMAMMLSGFRTPSSEITESETAIAVDGFGFVRDTGGPGKYRGSLAVFRRWRFHDHARVLVRDSLPGQAHKGRNGGGDGSPSRVTVSSKGKETVLEPRAMHYLDLEPGDVLEYSLPSAAGFGDPFERDPEMVLEDVLDDKVSIEQAEMVYGVFVNLQSSTVDWPTTLSARKSRDTTTPNELK